MDVIGNVTLERRNGVTHRTSTFSGQRLATSIEGGSTAIKYLYDSKGNVDCVVVATWASNSCPAVATGVTPASELVSDSVYDYRDRLVASRAYNNGTAGDKTEYRYDPLGRTTKKTATEASTMTTTDLTYLGVSDAVVREKETGGTTKDRSYAFDVLGNRATISETVSSTTSRWSYVYDPHRSTEILLDQANNVKATYGYTAYGEANPQLTKRDGSGSSGVGENTNLYRYTGKRWDPAAKAYDMGARTYYPGAGRWFQQDQYAGALNNLGLSTNPLTANRYSFTGANPINYIELDGHAFTADDLQGGRLLPGGRNPVASSSGGSVPTSGSPGSSAAGSGSVPVSPTSRTPAGGAPTISGSGSPSCLAGAARLGCIPQAFESASWNQRLAWLKGLDQEYGLGGWLGSFNGIIRYFRDSSYFGSSEWAKISDGWVLAAVQTGLNKSVNNVGKETRWSMFFDALFERSVPASTLRTLWGKAEQSGVELGVHVANSRPIALGSNQSELMSLFIYTGNRYRDAVTSNGPFTLPGIGTLAPRVDPRRDAGLVYRGAMFMETIYRGIWGTR
jgi:RHS repeat-associated protein